VSFYVSTATFFLAPLCDEWDSVVALPRHKFVTGATLLQLIIYDKQGTFSERNFQNVTIDLAIHSHSAPIYPTFT
jgi:hypothetical protein